MKEALIYPYVIFLDQQGTPYVLPYNDKRPKKMAKIYFEKQEQHPSPLPYTCKQ